MDPTNTTNTTPTADAAAAEAAAMPRHEWTIPLPSRFRDTLDKAIVTPAETSPDKAKPAATAEPETSSITEAPEAVEEDDELPGHQTDDDEETAAEEDAEEPEDTDDEEEDDEEVRPKTGKLLKRINKLTARAKTAEETLAKVQEELQTIKSAAPASVPAGLPVLHGWQTDAGPPTLADLDALEVSAQKTREWARQHRKTGATVGEVQYSPEEVQEILDNVKEDLEEGIPARRQFFEARAKHQAEAKKAFPQFFSDDTTAARVRAAARAIPGLDALPDADIIAGALMVGLQVMGGKLKTIKADPAKPAAAASPPVKKPVPKSIGAGSKPPGAAATQTLEALRKKAQTTRSPEDFVAYRRAKQAAQSVA